MANNSYISLDLETTGLNPKRERIIEIGAVKVVNSEITEQYHTLVNPGRLLTDEIKKLTGITDEDLKQAPLIGEILPDLLVFMGELPLLGHKIMFDYSFLKRTAVNRGIPFEKTGIDTLKIARKLLPELPSRNLGSLCEHFGIALQAHRALNDAKATHFLYLRLLQLISKPEDETLFVPIPLIYHMKKEGAITKAQKEQLYKLVQKHKIKMNVQIETLTKSEASRTIDKILFEYGRDI